MGAAKQAEDLAYEIVGDMNHGECFYELEEFYIVIGKIENLKRLVFEAYKEKEEESE